ncbi:transcription antitermination factor NusB [bacterium]|nr:transcription antitermination factor NusB [bacterium]
MKKSGSRHVAREYALRVLFGQEILRASGEDSPLPPTPNWWEGEDNLSVMPEAEKYAKTIFQGIPAELERVDAIIAQHSKNWRIQRMGLVDRNILRLSIHEFLFNTETAPRIILDEALELAKCYGNKDSVRFINGILDSVLRDLADPTASE